MICPTLKEIPPPPSDKIGWPWTEESTRLSNTMLDGSSWPLVSIVTPSYNQACFLEETIRSVLLQGYPNLEYYVMDGGSTDGSIEIIQKYARWLEGWVSEKDEGQSGAINKGLKCAKGQILAWLNSDDCYLPGCVSTMVSAFAKYPDAGMIYGNGESINECGKKLGNFTYKNWTFADNLTQKINVLQQAAFWRREVMDLIGMLRTDLHVAMDFEYWIRIGQHYPIKSIDKILAQYRMTRFSKGSIQRANWGPEFIRILDDLYAENNLTSDILVLKRKAYAGAYCRGAGSYLAANDIEMARSWLCKTVCLDPSYLRSIGWWQTQFKSLLGKRIYGWCRLLKSKLR